MKNGRSDKFVLLFLPGGVGEGGGGASSSPVGGVDLPPSNLGRGVPPSSPGQGGTPISPDQSWPGYKPPPPPGLDGALLLARWGTPISGWEYPPSADEGTPLPRREDGVPPPFPVDIRGMSKHLACQNITFPSFYIRGQ